MAPPGGRRRSPRTRPTRRRGTGGELQKRGAVPGTEPSPLCPQGPAPLGWGGHDADRVRPRAAGLVSGQLGCHGPRVSHRGTQAAARWAGGSDGRAAQSSAWPEAHSRVSPFPARLSTGKPTAWALCGRGLRELWTGWRGGGSAPDGGSTGLVGGSSDAAVRAELPGPRAGRGAAGGAGGLRGRPGSWTPRRRSATGWQCTVSWWAWRCQLAGRCRPVARTLSAAGRKR